MKKIFLISGFFVCSVMCMNHHAKVQKVLVDKTQLNFKQKFFPSVVVNNSIDIGNCCRGYMNISSAVKVMEDISFPDARVYACHHNNKESNVFIRYSNEFMRRVYNNSLDYKEAVAAIEHDENLMSYILTGQTHIYTQQELQEIKESFKKVVREYAKKQQKNI